MKCSLESCVVSMTAALPSKRVRVDASHYAESPRHVHLNTSPSIHYPHPLRGRRAAPILSVVLRSRCWAKIRFFWEDGAFDSKGEFAQDRLMCINKVRHACVPGEHPHCLHIEENHS